MTDQATVPEQQAAPQPMPVLTPQQAQSIKIAVLENYARLFNEFMTRVNQYPAMQQLKGLAFSHFESATAIMEKAIANMPLAIQTPQPDAPAEPAQAQAEAAAPEANETPMTPNAA